VIINVTGSLHMSTYTTTITFIFIGHIQISKESDSVLYTRKNLTSCNSLPTSRQQVVFALLVPRFQQVWNNLLTTSNNLVDIIVLVARLFQQVRYSHGITILLQSCIVNLVTFLLYHDCIRLVRTTLLQV
jgi:hypothetical protein